MVGVEAAVHQLAPAFTLRFLDTQEIRVDEPAAGEIDVAGGAFLAAGGWAEGPDVFGEPDGNAVHEHCNGNHVADGCVAVVEHAENRINGFVEVDRVNSGKNCVEAFVIS